MKVESLIGVTFTEDEVKEGLLCLLECELNDTVCNTPEYQRRKALIDHIKNTYTRIELEEGKFQLLADGIATVEDF